jgi:hypothetical protein
MQMKYFIVSLLILIPAILILSSFLNKEKLQDGTLSTTYVLDKLGDFSYPVGKKLAKRHKMKFAGADSVWNEHKPTILRLTFQLWTKEPLNRERARKIIVDCIDEYVSAINNAEPLLAQYLSHFPFSSKDIEITIYCADERGGDIYDPALVGIDVWDGRIFYRTKNPKGQYGYKSEYEETYEEAKEILKN